MSQVDNGTRRLHRLEGTSRDHIHLFGRLSHPNVRYTCFQLFHRAYNGPLMTNFVVDVGDRSHSTCTVPYTLYPTPSSLRKGWDASAQASHQLQSKTLYRID